MPEHTQRRKSLKRIDTPGHARELTFSTVDNLPLLATPEIAEIFLSHLRHACERHSFSLIAFVVMPDHVHLLGIPKNDVSSVSTFLASVKRSTSYQTKHWLEATYPERLPDLFHKERSDKQVFRSWKPGGGYDRNITSTEALHNSINYIHNNPVRAGLSRTPDEYPWSSACQWSRPNTQLPECMPAIDRHAVT